MPSLPKILCTKLNIIHLFNFVKEAQNDESLEL